jgi:hypothetical protein
MPTELEGFDEFAKDTDRIEKAFPAAMREASLSFARDWVNAAMGAAATTYATEAAQALMVSQASEGAEITNDSPVFFGSEFGGQSRPETMHFPPYNGRRGYWFYPARRANQEQLDTNWDDGIALAMKPWDRRG